MKQKPVTIVGGGLAGTEAAWQAANRGVTVHLYEMRPQRGTEAHVTDRLAELVCSNSMGSTLPDRALGILKQELLRMGSLIIRTAFKHALPAGAALAVSREDFAAEVTALDLASTPTSWFTARKSRRSRPGQPSLPPAH